MESSTKIIRIKLFRSFDKFMEDEKDKVFIESLAILTGVEEENILAISFRKRCVIFECKLDHEAADRLIEAYKKRNNKDASHDIKELQQFIEEYGVVSITDDFELKVNIIKSDKNKLIFIHGWRGDKESFGKMPELLSEMIGCESLIYEYPTGIWEKSPSVHYISKNLDNWIRNHTCSEKIALICHSMGGIISRDLMVSQFWRDKSLEQYIKQITFIASPHSGVAMAKLGLHVPLIRKAQISDLSTKSPFLVNLNNQWAQWTRRNVPNNCHTRSIYGLDDVVVDQSHALGGDPEAIPILNAGHINIVKAKSKDDEIVLTVKRLILESDFT